MKKERGITLVSLLIYVMAFSMILILLGVLTNYLYPKLSGVNSNGASAEEFNKFNTYFVTDIKQSKIAKVNNITPIINMKIEQNLPPSPQISAKNKQVSSISKSNFAPEPTINKHLLPTLVVKSPQAAPL